LATGSETVSEPFSRIVLAFTDDTFQEIQNAIKPEGSSADGPILDTLRELQNRLRNRNRGAGENIEAEILADLYNPKLAGAFNAFLFGKKRNDLRLEIRPRGALDCEEVFLLNADVYNEQAGILYSGHLVSEYKNGTASSDEYKNVIDVEHYKIENTIKGERLAATAEISFTAMVDGERVFGMDLLEELRVTRALFEGKETGFIQEDKKKDGAFYVIFPEPLVKGRKYKLTLDYQGEKVLENQGGGNFSVRYRTSWYPSVESFNDRATFDLTFKIPKQYSLVGVGKMVKEWQEGDIAVSQWVSEIPLAVAGFNYGRFKKKEVTDADTKYQIEGYAVSEMPDGLHDTGIGAMSPARLLDSSLTEATNAMRIFSLYYSPLPYGRIAITQQPEGFFGQAWPTLVFLPLVSYLDSTQRWMLFGPEKSLTDFVDEVNAHEVSHQWWGHIVGWSSYHDQWLSEGFAFFSAGLYLKMTQQKPDKFWNYWKNAQKLVLEKNRFGLRPNDAAPVWMGFRAGYRKIPEASQAMLYDKGGYVLHMLHEMMYDRQNGDKAFIAMMQDFVKTHYNGNASTESFKKIVDKHMIPQKMDLAGNKKMDWFFNQWVYGTEVPRYRLDYTLTPQDDGKCLLTFKVTQSDVSEGFRMPVPIYLDLDGSKIVRLGDVRMFGSSTSEEIKVPLPQKPKRVLINANYDVLATESVSVGK
jgi:Peptidase family M1 domain